MKYGIDLFLNSIYFVLNFIEVFLQSFARFLILFNLLHQFLG